MKLISILLFIIGLAMIGVNLKTGNVFVGMCVCFTAAFVAQYNNFMRGLH